MTSRFLAVAVAAVLNAAALSSGEPQLKTAVPGENARGVVVSDDGRELRLDATPCREPKTVIVFRQPYSREAAGSVNCGSGDIALVHVIQK
jgi:hypothetical protein